MAKNHTLSVNMIVRDMEDTIKKCIDSVMEIADEIIVIDTGSTDRTLEILQDLNVNYYQHEWVNDFSEARNVAIDHSNGEWILVIDADEILKTDRHTIKTLLKNNRVEGYWVIVENYISEDLLKKNAQKNCRLFRRRAAYRFYGKIHEQILPSILAKKSIETIKDSQIVIQHFGYLPLAVRKQNKIERNIQLLKQAQMDEPNNWFYLYNLGVEYMRLEKYHQAIESLKEVIEKENSQASYLHHAYYLLAKIALVEENDEKAVALLNTASNLYEDYTDLYYLLGFAYIGMGEQGHALDAFYKALELGEAPKKYITLEGVGTYLSHFEVGKIYLQSGYKKEALQRFYLCNQLQKGNRKVVNYIVQILIDQHPHDLTDQVDDFIEKDLLSKDMVCSILCEYERYEIAKKYLPTGNLLSLSQYEMKNDYLMNTANYLEAIKIQKRVLGLELTSSDEQRWIIDHLICYWKMDLPVPHAVIKRIQSKDSLRWLIQLIETKQTGEEENVPKGKGILLIDRLAHLGLITLIDEKLSLFNNSEWMQEKAIVLYKSGYVYRATDLLLSIMENQDLNEKAAFILGEISFKKQQYHYAAALFEKAQETNSQFWQAVHGAKLSYLYEGYTLLTETSQFFPQSELLQDQMMNIMSLIKQMETIQWQTQWTDREKVRFEE